MKYTILVIMICLHPFTLGAQDDNKPKWFEYDYYLDGNAVVANYEVAIEGSVGVVVEEDPHLLLDNRLQLKIRPVPVFKVWSEQAVAYVDDLVQEMKLNTRGKKFGAGIRKVWRKTF